MELGIPIVVQSACCEAGVDQHMVLRLGAKSADSWEPRRGLGEVIVVAYEYGSIQ